MKLKLIRQRLNDVCSVGELHVDGRFFCHTLEDVDRRLELGGDKVYGQTAIPRGTYTVILDYSAKFGRVMPHVLDVPGFTGIRIHPGNNAGDTSGCILVGDQRVGNTVGGSRAAYARLFNLVDEAYDRNEAITLEVT